MQFAAFQSYCWQFAVQCDLFAYRRFSHYVALLLRWSRAYNLTANATEAAIWQQITRCIPLVAMLPDTKVRCLDMGSGNGLPGVVSSILRPASHYTLVDSNGKKYRFLARVIQDLGLRAEACHTRIEDFAVAAPYDIVTARALASLDKLVTYALPLCHQASCVLTIKGVSVDAEIHAVHQKFKHLSSIHYPPTSVAPDTAIVCLFFTECSK